MQRGGGGVFSSFNEKIIDYLFKFITFYCTYFALEAAAAATECTRGV